MSENAPGRKVALVTGASAGLGNAICARLIERGWRVIAASRRGSSAISSPLLRTICLDVTDAVAFDAQIRDLLAVEGRIDAIVLNAGIETLAPAEELPLELAHEIMNTNFWGVVHGVKAVLGYFRERRDGTILVVGSLAGLTAPPGEAMYAASKHALEGWLESLQYEVAGFGIRVRLAEPGFMRTNMAKSSSKNIGTIADYDPIRTHLEAQWKSNLEHGLDVKTASKKLMGLVEKKHSPFRTRIGNDAVWIPKMKAILPERLFFFGARNSFGI